MYGVVTLLDAEHLIRFSEVRDTLVRVCPGFRQQAAPLAHFSWHIAQSYDLVRLQSVLGEFVRAARAFPARCAGLGVFTGATPIIYIRMVKDDPLAQLQRRLYERILPLSRSPSSFYTPESWVPHISLTTDIQDPDLLACAMRNLAFRVYDWEIWVDHLTIGYQDEQQGAEILQKYAFYG